MSFTSNITFEDLDSEEALLRSGRCLVCFGRDCQSWCPLSDPED